MRTILFLSLFLSLSSFSESAAKIMMFDPTGNPEISEFILNPSPYNEFAGTLRYKEGDYTEEGDYYWVIKGNMVSIHANFPNNNVYNSVISLTAANFIRLTGGGSNIPIQIASNQFYSATRPALMMLTKD